MYLIVGLGNPEAEYSKTRHNMGFDVINKIAKQYDIEMDKTKFKGIYGSGMIEGNKIILLKPQTYMNLSGQSIKEFVNFYKLALEDILVIYDDIDINPGMIKIRKKGGPGTHNGMKSVVYELQTEEFTRVRVGTGQPTYKDDLINHVIGKLTQEEYTILEKGIASAKEAVIEIVKNGPDIAMNKFN